MKDELDMFSLFWSYFEVRHFAVLSVIGGLILYGTWY